MNAYISLEHRFFKYQNELYTDGAFDQNFWNRYLKVFDQITIVARAKESEVREEKWTRVCNDRIKFHALPFYLGLKEKILRHRAVKRSIKLISNDKNSAYILRVGSPIADILSNMLIKNKISYAVEVVGDPWDVFAPGAFKNILRPLMRVYFSYKLKQQCRRATYSSYVTEFALQKRYPSVRAKLSINASSIELTEDFFSIRKEESFNQKRWLFVGTLEQYQKAPDVLIQAFNQIQDTSISLTIIGDGRKREELESMCRNSNVTFLGKLKSSKEVREYLLSHSYFVLPSRGEGLPRAMIEAMACSLICVGSKIGGIEELVDSKFIVPVNDISGLRDKIVEISSLNNNDSLAEGKRNYMKAKDYLKEKLEQRRTNFYTLIKNEVLTL